MKTFAIGLLIVVGAQVHATEKTTTPVQDSLEDSVVDKTFFETRDSGDVQHMIDIEVKLNQEIQTEVSKLAKQTRRDE